MSIKSANIETKFLPESELPYFARLNFQETEEVKMESESAASSSAQKETGSNDTTSDSKLPTNVSEGAIANLCKLGFTRTDVVEALSSSNGDENQAKVFLIAKSLRGPQ